MRANERKGREGKGEERQGKARKRKRKRRKEKGKKGKKEKEKENRTTRRKEGRRKSRRRRRRREEKERKGKGNGKGAGTGKGKGKNTWNPGKSEPKKSESGESLVEARKPWKSWWRGRTRVEGWWTSLSERWRCWDWQREREKQLKYYGEIIPNEVGPVETKIGVLSAKMEIRNEDREEMRKEEVMGEGKIRLFFQQGSGPDDVFDFGEHQGSTCRGSVLEGPPAVVNGR